MAKPQSSTQAPTKAAPRASKLYEVYITCEMPLRRFISRFFSRTEDIDDLAQEAFLRAFDTELKVEIRSPKAYLFRVARNMALRELGKKSRQLTDYLEEATDSDTLAVEGSAEQELIAQQKLQQCCRAIADLPEQCRRVFLLRKIHAYSHKDIAAAPGTTSSNTSKASSPQKSSS